MRFSTLSTPGGEIAYTDIGTGPAALFVHGLATSGVLWQNVIDKLAETTRCVAMTAPGRSSG